MRYHRRLHLPEGAVQYLFRKQEEVTRGADARETWKKARKTKIMQQILGILQKMAGVRERCMYCHDSFGAEMDHFWPIAIYVNKAFCWDNFLLLCGKCNKLKTDKFALGADGVPLFIDPTADNPWSHIVYDSHVDLLSPRWRADGTEDPKGRFTIDALKELLDRESVAEGRRRTRRAIQRAIREFFDDRDDDALWRALLENDNYGLLDWYFLSDGKSDEPVRELYQNDREVFNKIHHSLMRFRGLDEKSTDEKHASHRKRTAKKRPRKAYDSDAKTMSTKVRAR